MNSVPYLYVNLAALGSFIVLFATFCAAKKTPERRSAQAIFACFMLWTIGSLLMRLQVYPGTAFWYYLSLLSLFATPLAMFYFICSFTGGGHKRLKMLWTAGTVALLAVAGTGVFLEPPVVQVSATGEALFLYAFKWPIIIPCLFVLAILGSIFKIFLRAFQQGERPQGIAIIFIGLGSILAGNLAQLIPGNIFPTDTLGGLICCCCITYTLIRKRMFFLELFLSPRILIFFVMSALSILLLFFVSRQEQPILAFIGREKSGMSVILVWGAVAFWLAFACVHWLIYAIFPREKRQKKTINAFSHSILQSLNVEDVLHSFTHALDHELGVSPLRIFLKNGNHYVTAGMGARVMPEYVFSSNCAVARRIHEGETFFYTDSMEESPQYFPLFDESACLNALGACLIFSLKADGEAVGFVVMPPKRRFLRYLQSELRFMDTLCNMASAALRNAVLYERMYKEARLDHLTGLFNYNYFVAKLNAMTNAADLGRAGPGGTAPGELALVYLDVDDMKLYNQLYGTETGDAVLKRVAAIIRVEAGEAGMAFRHSGKVFALLLPGCGEREAHAIACGIQSRLAKAFEKHETKAVTLSCGVCVYPGTAKNAQQLTHYADMAVFNAKNNGKGTVEIFRSAATEAGKVAEQVRRIVSHTGHKDPGRFSSYSATILALTAAIDAKDHYTYNHSQNVAYYASMLAAAARLSDMQVRLVHEAALLHDIGKISIPEQILCKTGPLARHEKDLMNGHVDNAVEIIRHLPSMDYVIPVTIAHHERWDGKGYPRGIAGEEIPIGARCLAVADSFDAMTTDRSYRARCSTEYALQELSNGSGTQFDPHIVRIFLSLVYSGELVIQAVSRRQLQMLS